MEGKKKDGDKILIEKDIKEIVKEKAIDIGISSVLDSVLGSKGLLGKAIGRIL